MSNTLKFGNGTWATKEGSTLAYNDENNNFKPLPFNFERSTGATRVNKQGLIEVVSNNEPRIDFKDSSEGALLLEPSRSNLITYSEDFSNAAWGNNGTIVSNASISPDGTQNAELFYASTDTGRRVFQNKTIVSGLSYTVSVYAKANNKNFLYISDIDNQLNVVWFDLLNGTYSTPSEGTANIESIGNDWYRCSLTTISSTTTGWAYFGISDTSNSVSFTANGTDGIYLWGAMIEQGSYATSYIPTQGSIGTRVAETCEQTVPNGIIGQTEGTVFIETKLAQEIPSSSGYFSISDGTANNSYIVQFRNNGTLRIYQNGLDGSNLAFVDSNINLSKNNKIAFKYEQSISSMTLYINGVEISLLGGFVYENTTGINNIKMAYVSGSLNLYSEINDIKLYNKALSNAELQALTKI